MSFRVTMGSVRRSLLMLLAAALLVAPALVLAQSVVPSCVNVRSEARWGASAYNHVVIVQNTCDEDARCQVATNVTPTPTQVDVPAGETVETVTFLGSPAREFTPRVRCELQR